MSKAIAEDARAGKLRHADADRHFWHLNELP